jgi:plasmid stability protein
MSKSVQIRNVPDKVHAVYRARAAKAGKSLSEYLLLELRRLAEMPTNEEFLELVQRQKPVRLKTSPASILRAERASR